MDELKRTEENKLISILHREGDMSLPFIRDIFLFDTYVAGTSHVEEIEEIIKTFKPEDRLILRREPLNEYDELAILVLTEKEEKIGYIPRKYNSVLARLMDAGKLLYGVIDNIAHEGQWVKIWIKIYMKDV